MRLLSLYLAALILALLLAPSVGACPPAALMAPAYDPCPPAQALQRTVIQRDVTYVPAPQRQILYAPAPAFDVPICPPRALGLARAPVYGALPIPVGAPVGHGRHVEKAVTKDRRF